MVEDNLKLSGVSSDDQRGSISSQSFDVHFSEKLTHLKQLLSARHVKLLGRCLCSHDFIVRTISLPITVFCKPLSNMQLISVEFDFDLHRFVPLFSQYVQARHYESLCVSKYTTYQNIYTCIGSFNNLKKNSFLQKASAPAKVWLLF